MKLIKRWVIIGVVPLLWFTIGAVFILAIAPSPPSELAGANDKIQHIFAFAVLTILASLAYRHAHWSRIFWPLLGFGALIESIQMVPALGRDAEWLDLAADGAAIALLLLISRLFRNLPQPSKG